MTKRLVSILIFSITLFCTIQSDAKTICGLTLSYLAEGYRTDFYQHFALHKQHFLNNISPAKDPSDLSKGYYWGAVVAATSTKDPNYQFDWGRDGGITMTTLAHLYKNTKDVQEKNLFVKLMVRYLEARKKFQETPNSTGKPTRNGNLDVYPNYGEAKSTLDFKSVSPWMNPQTDSSAYSLKAYLFIAEQLWEQWDSFQRKDSWLETSLTKDDLYNIHSLDQNSSLIKRALEYSLHNWSKDSYEMWEESMGKHFATLAAHQAVMLAEGPRFANMVGDSGAVKVYYDAGLKIDAELLKFWNQDKKVILPTIDEKFTINPNVKKTNGIDLQVIIGICHGKSPTFTPANPMSLSTVYHGEIFFKDLYAANKGQRAVLWGRYLGDAYSGDGRDNQMGRAWFLTYYLAEHSLKVARELFRKERLTVTDLDVEFYNYVLEQTQHSDRLTVGQVISIDQPLFTSVIEALIQRALLIDKRLQDFVTPDGRMSEQIFADIENARGPEHQRSAENLTWSYAAKFRMLVAYEKLIAVLKGVQY